MVLLLWLVQPTAAQASSRTKAPAPPSAAAQATPVAPAAAAAAPAAPLPEPAPGGQLDPPPAGAKADQIADYATALFKQQRYSEAGDALKLAYQREPRPIFLFNVGQTYRKAGRYADAIAAYKRFAADAPTHPLASEARGYEHTLAVLVEQQERTSQIEMSLMDKQAENERARQNLALEQRKAEDAQTALAAEKAKQKPIYRRPWFWAVISGAAVGALAIALGNLTYNNSVRTDGGNQKFMFPSP
jgi:tetratricopeptide (TPR) repeat protein